MQYSIVFYKKVQLFLQPPGMPRFCCCLRNRTAMPLKCLDNAAFSKGRRFKAAGSAASAGSGEALALRQLTACSKGLLEALKQPRIKLTKVFGNSQALDPALNRTLDPALNRTLDPALNRA
jgi:hypothetical protein